MEHKVKNNNNFKNDIEKISLVLLKKITKEIKKEIIDDQQIKKIQSYTKLLEQLNKICRFVEQEVEVEFLDQDSRILENYLKFDTEKMRIED